MQSLEKLNNQKEACIEKYIQSLRDLDWINKQIAAHYLEESITSTYSKWHEFQKNTQRI